MPTVHADQLTEDDRARLLLLDGRLSADPAERRWREWVESAVRDGMFGPAEPPT